MVHFPNACLAVAKRSLRQRVEAAEPISLSLALITCPGRVDLKGDIGRYITIDTADNFEEPHWEVSRSDRRSDGQPFTRKWL